MKFIKDDGGRGAAGYKGSTGDCVTRAIAIATGRPYQEVYDELPRGRVVVSLSRHAAAVIDGVLHDTEDCSRNGTRCVYGYWQP